jgi:hypothetical protein
MSAHVRIAELAAILHPSSSRWRPMALAKAFFDETGTDERSSIVAIGGFVGHDVAWARIQPNWESVLRDFEDRGVEWLHTTDAIAQEGQFARIDKPRLDYILTQLSKTLGAEELTPFFSAVVKQHWDEVVTDTEFIKRFPTPLDLCFENVLHKLWKWGRQYADGKLIVPMFAYEKSSVRRMAEIGHLYGAHEWYCDVLGALAFDYPRRVIGLQAADLLSHQMRWDVEKGISVPMTLDNIGATNILTWSTKGKQVQGNLFDADGLRRTMKRVKEAGYPFGPVPIF